MGIIPEWLTLAASLIWLGVSATSLIASAHALAPTRKGLWLVLSFFATWLTMELASYHIVFLLVGAAGLLLLRGWDNLFGILAIVFNLISIALLLRHIADGRKAAVAMKEALSGYVQESPWPRIPRSKLLLPFSPARENTKRTKDIVYARAGGQNLRLDVIEPAVPPKPGERRPALVQIHGGAWIVGDKREQALPLLYHLASHGWVTFNVNYRLSPNATFPDHLIDIKRAIAWVREHADEYQIDPDFIAVTGGSAGGHLCAMVTLTNNDPRYQPGFEDADTSVQASVPIYGVYDFTDRLNIMGPIFRKRMLEPLIMKAFYDEEPEKFRDASPLEILHTNLPPTLLIHGDHDVLAPVEYARIFAKEMKETSKNPVFYAELPGAQHAFDIFASHRSVRVVSGVERFLDTAREKHPRGEKYSSPYAAQTLNEDSSLPLA